MNQASTTRSGRLRIREMTIDDLSEVFHIGEEIFTADLFPTLYRTWDEYEITTLFNSDSELCLVGEIDDRIVGFALGTTVEKHRSPGSTATWSGSGSVRRYRRAASACGCFAT
jgi:hypothetical protein